MNFHSDVVPTIMGQLVPGTRHRELELVLDQLFAIEDPHALAAALDPLQTTLLVAIHQFYIPWGSQRHSDYEVETFTHGLGRFKLHDSAHTRLEDEGTARLACQIAGLNFAYDQLAATLMLRYERKAPADEVARFKALRLYRGPFSEIAAPRIVQRLLIAGWRPPTPGPMTRRELLEAAKSFSFPSDDDDAPITDLDVEAASLMYGTWFDQAPTR